MRDICNILHDYNVFSSPPNLLTKKLLKKIRYSEVIQDNTQILVFTWIFFIDPQLCI